MTRRQRARPICETRFSNFQFSRKLTDLDFLEHCINERNVNLRPTILDATTKFTQSESLTILTFEAAQIVHLTVAHAKLRLKQKGPDIF